MRRNALCLASIMLLTAYNGFGQEYYVSNPLGMVLRSVTKYEKGSHPWILEIKAGDGGSEVRILYHNDSVDKKYIKRITESGTVISVWEGGRMVGQTEYSGRYVTKESVFSENGDVETTEYTRDGDRLKSVSRFRNDVLLFTDTFITGFNGRLYQVRRTYPDGRKDIFGVRYSGKEVASEWSKEGDRSSIYYFENNDLVGIQEYEGDKLVSYEEKSGDGSGVTTGRDITKEETTVRKYDDKNRLVYQEVFGKDTNIVISYKYSNDLLAEKLVKTPGNREKHVYSYDAGGNLLKEDVYVNNTLQKIIKPLGDGKMEETVFKNGIPLLKVVTKDGVEISRETVGRDE